jgi:myo-inositol-1(or 4)-monophosphatase
MAAPTTSKVEEVDVEALERLAVDVAVAAARLVVDERPTEVEATATKSSPTDIVTAMDTRAEELIRGMLVRSRPDDGVLGEEGDDRQGSTGITWVVDPIDGTVNYLYDIPAYAVSVAATTGDPRTPGRWHVLAGAVAEPALRRVYHARRGGGAWRRDWHTDGIDDRSSGPLKVGTVHELSGALVGTGFAYTAERRLKQAETLRGLLPRVRDIRRMGSAALDLVSVASGRLDGFYEVGLNPWDIAAGWLLVTEAGGVMTGNDGGPPSRELTVAANPHLQPRLLALVDEAAG